MACSCAFAILHTVPDDGIVESDISTPAMTHSSAGLDQSIPDTAMQASKRPDDMHNRTAARFLVVVRLSGVVSAWYGFHAAHVY